MGSAAAVPVGAVHVAAQAPWVGGNGVTPLVQGQVITGEASDQAAMGSPEVAESQSISNVGQPISGSMSGPLSTPGSVEHGTGKCNPCAWYWKARGCASGVQCDYCHLCAEGELKKRKKLKIADIKSGAREPAHPRPEVRKGA